MIPIVYRDIDFLMVYASFSAGYSDHRGQTSKSLFLFYIAGISFTS